MSSGIGGGILLGPPCPIYRDGDTNCAPVPYVSSLVIKNEARTQTITAVTSDDTAHFLVALPPGKYWLEMPNTLHRFPYLKPMLVTVPTDQYVQTTVYYDTGIR